MEKTQARVREYLYVDVPRVRTLLAQLALGLPQERRSDRTRQWSASLTGIEGQHHEEGSSDQEVRSLADLHVAMLEDDAEFARMLADVTEVSKKPKNWNRGRIHKALNLGSLIRITGPTSFIYPASFAKSVTAFDVFSDDKTFSTEVTQIVKAMYGEHLTLRVFPCGEGEREYQFSGVISDAGGYLAGEKSVLFSRLGADLQNWTTLATVSRIPERDHMSPTVRLEQVMGELQQAFSRREEVNRQILEKMIQETSRAIEGMGFTEAPVWPAISIIPIAIYREVVPSIIGPELEAED
ncbi:DUF6414 family protein [Streptomyces spinosisporus]|uniref:Uncharacterized protein n=1 Tax=Streptomyces spinosisporus TaxID=2927582 RepID=A0ABS9XHV8_9ACTN|nr:hypothetical protein [Streptomyces spinosisporus]MCI3240492.1 hypothetical protein [Streptomyces spinosisporus]